MLCVFEPALTWSLGADATGLRSAPRRQVWKGADNFVLYYGSVACLASLNVIAAPPADDASAVSAPDSTSVAV